MKHALLASMLVMASAVTLPVAPAASAAAANPAARKPDLADRVAGTYEGAVTSDSRGSSREGVTVTVTRVGGNLVEISCDYDRIPTTRIPLEIASDAILAAGGTDSVFLVELKKDPNRIDLYIDGAALTVRR